MAMKSRIGMSLLCAGLLVGSAIAMAQSEGAGQAAHHRVVMHVNSGDEQVQRGIVNNVRHLFQEVGREHLTVEVVAHGAGLSLLMKSTTPFAGDLAALQTQYGVRYTACSNTMKSMHLTRADLIDEVGDTVPAMVRLMERQEQGWVYIKP
jgi:intracellular sulfur oxidation DsrE/DsrF family protein